METNDEYLKKVAELKESSKPLIDWIKKYGNPHTTIIITEDGVKVVSDELYFPIATLD